MPKDSMITSYNEDTIQEVARLLHVEITEDNSDEDIISLILKKLVAIPYIPFPVSLHTVDMALIRIDKETHEIEIALGRKKGRELYQFLGGFMDPGEISKKSAAREINEESELVVSPHSLLYQGSFFIDDKRYADSCHKITSDFFVTEIPYEYSLNAKGADDIEEIKWFKLSDLVGNCFQPIIAPLHWDLMEHLIRFIYSHYSN